MEKGREITINKHLQNYVPNIFGPSPVLDNRLECECHCLCFKNFPCIRKKNLNETFPECFPEKKHDRWYRCRHDLRSDWRDTGFLWWCVWRISNIFKRFFSPKIDWGSRKVSCYETLTTLGVIMFSCWLLAKNAAIVYQEMHFCQSCININILV